MREKEKVEMRMILLLIVVNKLTNGGGHSLTYRHTVFLSIIHMYTTWRGVMILFWQKIRQDVMHNDTCSTINTALFS